MAAFKQQGAGVVFGSSGGTWEFTNIGRYSEPIPVLDDTHLGTTNRRTKIPGQLKDPQMLTVQLHNSPTATLPVIGLVQTITINGPLGAFATAENWAGTGFVVDIRTPEFASDTEAIQIIEMDIQFDGKTGPARTAATTS